MKIVLLAISLVVTFPSWAGLNEGVDAYEAGDYVTALREFRPLAERGQAQAQFGLCVMYSFGRGVREDLAEGLSLCRMAADQGLARAQNVLGYMYEDSHGVPRDYQEAARWFRKAAEQGYAPAQRNLGIMYSNGKGVEQDFNEAVRWLRAAAEQREAQGQFHLGLSYEWGRGVPQDYKEAAKWYLRAAQAGWPAAQFYLAASYRTGQGVSRDYQKSIEWYRRAADQNYARAQHDLAVQYATGNGVPKDNVLAYMWFNLAAARGIEDSESSKSAAGHRDKLALQMSPSEIAEAQRLGRQWNPRSEDRSGSDATRGQTPTGMIELESTGSGIVIAKDGLILTNHHVIRDCAQVRIAPSKALVFIVATDDKNDLALLQGSAGKSGGAVFRDGRSIRPGEEVIVLGYPLRGILASAANVTSGVVSALAGPGNNAAMMQITAPVQPGNSGGPVLDGSGHVVAVVLGKLDAIKIAKATGDIPQNVNFAITGAVVRAFLDANRISYQRAVSSRKVGAAEIVERSRGHTVLVECWK
jgi:uncharacterized protein